MILFAAKDLDRHYLLSGDTDGIIIIWELSTVNNNVKKTFILILSWVSQQFMYLSELFGLNDSGDMYCNYHSLTRKV